MTSTRQQVRVGRPGIAVALALAGLLGSVAPGAWAQPGAFREDPELGMRLFTRGTELINESADANGAKYKEVVLEALQCLSQARRHLGDRWDVLYYKAMCHTMLWDPESAMPIFQALVVEIPPMDPRILSEFWSAKADAHQQLVQKDAALADYKKAIGLDPNNLVAHVFMGLVSRLSGDAAGMRRCCEEADRVSGAKMGFVLCWIAESYRMEGKLSRAAELFAEAAKRPEQLSPSHARSMLGQMHALEAGKPGYSLAAAQKIFTEILAEGKPIAASGSYGIFLTRSGRHAEAIEQYEARARVDGDPELLLCTGESLLAVGRTEDARRPLVHACRWNPRLLERVRRMEGGEPMAAEIARLLGDLAGVDASAAFRVDEDLGAIATRSRAVDSELAGFRFDQAALGYRAFGSWAQAASLKAELKDRIAWSERGQAVFVRLGQSFDTGKIAPAPIEVAGKKTAIDGGDARRFRCRIDGGTVWLPWRLLPVTRWSALADGVAPTAGERVALGVLAWLNDDEAVAYGQFLRARSDGAARAETDRFVAGMRGIDLPAAGFVVSGQRLVTTEELAFAKAGKLSFRGRWVASDERDKLLAGQVSDGGRWRKLTPEELAARGLVERAGKWLLPAELPPGGADWEASAVVHDTAHFRVRTDLGKAFAARVGIALEATRERLAGLLGAAPETKTTLLAFARRRDYQAYLARFQGEAHASAADGATAMCGSEPGTACAWNRAGDPARFVEAVVGVAARQHALDVYGARTPAWLAAALEAHCGTLTVAGTAVAWKELPRARLSLLRRVVVRKSLVPLAALETPDAAIQADPARREAFEVQSWATLRYLSTSIDEPIRAGFKRYLERLKSGPVSLAEALGAEAGLFDTGFAFFAADLS